MQPREMIEKRRSVRSYTDTPVEAELLEKIKAFMAGMTPLYPDIRMTGKLVTREQVRFYFPWKAPQLVAIYSENKPGYLENVGFAFQQLDLYLQSLGLGSCWMGLGKVRQPDAPEGMEFVILLAFGYTDSQPRTERSAFKRKGLEEISDREDPALEPARLAPSSTNSQPWYFTHEDDTVHAFCTNAGQKKHKMLGAMNRIDMGIALAHLYMSSPETFRFFRADPPALKGFSYIGSLTL